MLVSTGGETNEVALGMVKMASGRFEIVGLTKSWHGLQAGVATLNLAGERLLKGLREQRDRHEQVGEVRGMGLLVGMELVKDRDGRPADGLAAAVSEECLRRGMSMNIVRSTGGLANCFRMAPRAPSPSKRSMRPSRSSTGPYPPRSGGGQAWPPDGTAAPTLRGSAHQPPCRTTPAPIAPDDSKMLRW